MAEISSSSWKIHQEEGETSNSGQLERGFAEAFGHSVEACVTHRLYSPHNLSSTPGKIRAEDLLVDDAKQVPPICSDGSCAGPQEEGLKRWKGSVRGALGRRTWPSLRRVWHLISAFSQAGSWYRFAKI